MAIHLMRLREEEEDAMTEDLWVQGNKQSSGGKGKGKT